MHTASIVVIVIELIIIIVLAVYLGLCHNDSKENLCVCQGEGKENCRDRYTRVSEYNQGKFKPLFAGV